MIEVVFVDDEQHVLSGLRRALYHMRDQWRMRFVASGAEALKELARTPADVIVSDMRMPGMDGRELLCLIRDQYPGTIRIVLSGQTDLEATLTSVGVSHCFLDKPCDPATLEGTVSRLLAVRERISSPRVREFVGSIGSLPTTPSVVDQLNALLLDPEASPEAVIAIMETDPAVTAQLLQLANSSMLGLGHPVDDVRTAVETLGLEIVRDLATATAAFSMFSPASPPLTKLTEDLERYSVEVAVLAAQLIEGGQAPLAFSAGMLHDVGILIVAASAEAEWGQIGSLVKEGMELTEAEDRILGVTHAEIGSYLLALWGLPGALCEAVTWHHDATGCTPWLMSPVHAVYLAEQLLDRGTSFLDDLDPEYLEAIGGESIRALVAQPEGSAAGRPPWKRYFG